MNAFWWQLDSHFHLQNVPYERQRLVLDEMRLLHHGVLHVLDNAYVRIHAFLHNARVCIGTDGIQSREPVGRKSEGAAHGPHRTSLVVNLNRETL